MIACCGKCTGLFETTEEDANDPTGVRCPECYKRERLAARNRRYVPLIAECDDDALFILGT